MSVTTFILAWIMAVACMTLFSAIWSLGSGNQFREPTLLSQIFSSHPANVASQTQSYVLGWVLHLVLGAIFLGVYEVLWQITDVDRTFAWSLVFGTLLGIIGIFGWKLLFKAVNFPSQFNYMQYYIHIFCAHLVFSVTALIVFKWLH